MISISGSFTQSIEAVESSESVNYIGNGFNIFSNVLVLTQILLLILMAYSGIKTGMNYREMDKNTIHNNG